MHKTPNCELSPLEIAVTRLLRKGETLPAVAENLDLSINTVKSCVKSIYLKLHVHNRMQLANALAEMHQG